MEPDRCLIATAQISLALAGFAGVVAAYRNQSEQGWGEVELFWLRLLLLNAILPFSFSMLGIFILAVGPLPIAEWRWSSGFAAVCLVPYCIMIFRKLRRFAPETLQTAGSGLLISRTLYSALIVVCLLQLWNAVAGSAFWPFLAAITALILGAVFQFARLVMTSHRSESHHGPKDISEEA